MVSPLVLVHLAPGEIEARDTHEFAAPSMMTELLAFAARGEDTVLPEGSPNPTMRRCLRPSEKP